LDFLGVLETLTGGLNARMAGGCWLAIPSNCLWIGVCRILSGGLAIIKYITLEVRKTKGFLN